MDGAHTLRCLLLGLTMLTGPAWADWPLYRGDAQRSARRERPLDLPLALAWTHEAAAQPRPAWPRSTRMLFDRAPQLVAAHNRVVFGSSADGMVTAIDAQQGEVSWEFFTEGPVRFAPAIWRDRVLVVSDDGFLYALNLSNGALLWKRRGGPRDSSVLGNDALISRWPARGGPVICEDIVYFAAGIWPSEGIYLYALAADSGEILWCNAESGGLEMPQPHPTAEAKSGVAAQGHLVLAGDTLLVPTGRAVPACFDRQTGALRYFHLQQYGQNGEDAITAMDNVFFNGGLAFDLTDGQALGKLGPGPLAATQQGLVRAFGGSLAEYTWREEEKPDRKGEMQKVRLLAELWKLDHLAPATTVATAGHHVILGGEGHVTVIDSATRSVAWEAPVAGTVWGLALHDEQLLVSTDRGTVTCFGPAAAAHPAPHDMLAPAMPPEPDARVVAAADEILRRSGMTEGYCLDLGCGDGELARALAERSGLQVIAVDADAEHVRRAREMLRAAGLYGTRVVVHQRELSTTGYPAYFADLIVSRRALEDDLPSGVPQEADRLLRPWGGARCWGPPHALDMVVRGALDGAGNWTHQYADAANTANSGDQLLRGTLRMLWFRDVDFDLPSRHGRAPAPLASQWRLFHQGLDGLVAVNAYNGRELWRYPIPNVLRPYDGDELMGVAGTGSNFCLGAGHVYVRHEHRCLQLDAATGQWTAEFTAVPGTDDRQDPWGYIAWSAGTLYGTTANPEHIVTYRFVDRGGDLTRQLTESRRLFAIDTDSGQTQWVYEARDSLRHNAIAIAAGKVFLIDRPLAMFDRVKQPDSKEHPPGRLLALDAHTGALAWENADNIFGTMLAISEHHGVVLMSYQPTAFRLDSEIGGRLAAFRTDDGTRLWDVAARYDSRPTLRDRTIYTQGGAWDLLTGEPVPFTFQRSYGCGILAGSEHMLLFRSATLGYFDLSGSQTTENYGGIRPGCWINALPAGGIVLAPDASAKCVCSYLNQAWIALAPGTP